jgi:hypothetical protein
MGVLAIVFGGSVTLVIVWGFKHLVWGVAIVLVVLVALAVEGAYREWLKVPAEVTSASLVPLQELAMEGRAIQARLPERGQGGLGGLPPDLPGDFQAWEAKAASVLEPWPPLRAQFLGKIGYGLVFLEPDRKCAEVRQRTKVFAQIVRVLADQDKGR